jgi:SWI/SNF related-matrix-associated actin-dependent regulator of chromatin subfamily C
MALVAFLATMVGPEVAAGSAQSALKAISEEAPAIQLAARHCFLLEDPPSDTKDNTNERTDAQKLENETLPLEHSKDSEKDTSKIESVSAIPEASKETDMVEATPSKQQPELVDSGSNLAMSEEETGKVDPEKPCSANDKKCSEDSTETEDSRPLDKLKDENDKKCLQDSIETDNSPNKMKDADEKKCLQDSIEVEHSLFDKMKHENEKKSPEDSVEIVDDSDHV